MGHVFESAPSGRAKCRGCGKKIDKGVLRFGERMPNMFGEGEMTLWFHPVCACYKRPEAILEAMSDAEDAAREGESDSASKGVAEGDSAAGDSASNGSESNDSASHGSASEDFAEGAPALDDSASGASASDDSASNDSASNASPESVSAGDVSTSDGPASTDSRIDPSWISLAESGTEHERLPRLDGAERAPSGRARCRHCRELIEKGDWRLKLVFYQEGMFEPSGNIHAPCAAEYFGTREVMGRIRWFSDLTEADLEEVAALVNRD